MKENNNESLSMDSWVYISRRSAKMMREHTAFIQISRKQEPDFRT
jgi:hypothetical protein